MVEIFVTLAPSAIQELEWWRDQLKAHNGKDIIQPPPIEMGLGWGQSAMESEQTVFNWHKSNCCYRGAFCPQLSKITNG